MYTVYMHTAPNGKVYVGITMQKPEKRWGNGLRYQQCTAFWHAIQKFGWENIEHEIIETCDDLETANAREKYWIAHYHSQDHKYGYNLTEGGDGVSGWKATEEQKKKNSDAKKRNWQDEEFRKRLTEERKKRGSTQEEKERLRQMTLKNWQDEKMRKHLLECLETIRNDENCKAKRKATMQRLWKEDPDRFMKNKVYKKGAENKRSKPVYCVELDKIFVNAREADKETGISYKYISACATGRIQTTGGYHWKFV